MKFKSLGLPAALLAATFLAAACQNTARGIEEDAEKNAAAAKAGSREADNAASQAREDIKNAAGKVAEETKEMAGNAADLVKEAAGKTADKLRESGRDAEQATRNASGSAGDTADAAQQTAEIKTALVADAQIDASGVNVDTDAATRSVTLKGHVPTAAQKAAAERIAREKAPSYKVVNDLVIR